MKDDAAPHRAGAIRGRSVFPTRGKEWPNILDVRARHRQDLEQVEIAPLINMVADGGIAAHPRHVTDLPLTEIAEDVIRPAILVAVLHT